MREIEIAVPLEKSLRADEVKRTVAKLFRLSRNAVIRVVDPTRPAADVESADAAPRASATCVITRRSIDARGKAEVEGKPREDDYFEATLVDSHNTLNLLIKVRLTARKGMDIRAALSRMVDLPLDFVYTELSRNPWQLKKFRVVLTAEEIASLTGVTLIDE